ncbi:MAG TPA: chorismate-binding protein, partial [Devosia sp.]
MSDQAFERFAELYDAGRAQIVWRRIVADLETPVGTYLKLAEGRKNTYLLESVQDGTTRGRYSIIGSQPDVILKVEAGSALINRQVLLDEDAYEPVEAKPLDALRQLVADSKIEVPPGLPAQSAGIYGYLGYDMVRHMEVLPDSNPNELGNPDAILMRPSLLAVFDTLKDELYLTAPVYVREGVTARQAYETSQGRIDDAIGRLSRATPTAPALADLATIEVTSNTSRDEYFAMVARAKEYITAGDIFQVVLSQRFAAEFKLPPTALYRALRRTNPSPYMYFLDFGRFAIAGSSPEILVRVKNGEVTIRPIAGTRKRGATPT